MRNQQADSDWADHNYIFYFPFINFFVSRDKFFQQCKEEFPCFETIEIIETITSDKNPPTQLT